MMHHSGVIYIYILCYILGPILKLIDGTDKYGRLAIEFDGVIGAVRFNPTKPAVEVACKQLGFVDGVSLNEHSLLNIVYQPANVVS